MAEDVMVNEEPFNSCCQSWKEKYENLRNGRNALRKGLSILEQQCTKLQAENLNLKKAYEDERARVGSEKEDKLKEYAMRSTLENEISSLKSQILLLRENGGLVGRGVDQDAPHLQLRISEAEAEINQLKELLRKERKRVDEEKEQGKMERRKTEKALEKAKAERDKANEEKRLIDMERKKDEELQYRFETLKCDLDEVKSKLASETARYEQVIKKLKAERESTRRVRERADKELTAKAEDQRKLAEANWKKAMDERSHADQLSQQLEQYRKRIDELENELSKFVSTRNLVETSVNRSASLRLVELASEAVSGKMTTETDVVEACKKVEELEEKIIRVKNKATYEKKKVKEKIRVAESYKRKAMEEKNRADDLSCKLEGYKQRLDGVQKEIQELVSSGKCFEYFCPASVGSLKEETAEMKLLRKQLKFEKMRVKHAKEVLKMEEGRNEMLCQEVHRIKQELIQFSQHVDILDKCLFLRCDALNSLEKVGRRPNLEPDHFHLKPSEMILHTENEYVKPNFPVRQKKECSVPLPPASGEICTSPLTGIDSNLELLLRGSNGKILKTSAINSSSASFSDRPLVGSQEKGTLSVTTSALLAEAENLEPTKSCLSSDSKKGYDEKLAVEAENSVVSPIKSVDTARKERHRKRKRLESSENRYLEGQKWHLQLLQKLNVLHDMLNCESLKPMEAATLLLPELQGNIDSKLVRPHKKKKPSILGVETRHSSELKTKRVTLRSEISEVHKHACTTECNRTSLELRDDMDYPLGGTWNLPWDDEGFLVHDAMKLTDLNDDNDEKRFLKAIEEPLSPLSPTLCNIEFPCMEASEIEMLKDMHFYPDFSMSQGNVVPSCGFDVMEVEIGSNNNERSSNSDITCTSSDQIQNSCMLSTTVRDEISKLSCGSGTSALNKYLKYCAISSNEVDNSSIIRIFHFCSEFIAQFSVNCSVEMLVQNIVPTLQKAGDLSDGERVSVFFSLLLHYIPEIPAGDYISFSDFNSLQLIDSFAQQMHAVMNDVYCRKMFLELCNVGGSVVLLEDFLLNGKIVVFDDVSHTTNHGSYSRAITVPNGSCIFWSIGEASTDLLFTGGLLLASVCASVDQIGFICELSYNLFSTRKINFSFLLRLLHLFAYICGPKYFTLEDYHLEMCVLKSLVVFLEKMYSTTGIFSCLPSMAEPSMKIATCKSCLFLKDVASVDFVVSLLLEKLQNYTLAPVGKQDLGRALPSSNSVSVFHEMRDADIPRETETVLLNVFSNQYTCCFIDILSLVELVASFMTWDCTYVNIISRLCQMLDSKIPGHLFPAIIALLGQLGRIGVDAKGYEDSRVDNLREWLVAFLHRNAFRSFGLSVQFASVTALLGLIARPFEEVVEPNFDIRAIISQSAAMECVRAWFSSLTMEQQSSFRSIPSSADCFSTTAGPASDVLV